jgi:hypothetical protein
MNIMRPGNGWKHLAGPVWGHTNGTRMHTAGMVRLPDRKTFFSLNKYPESIEGYKYIKMNGGNIKRGLMAWANYLC